MQLARASAHHRSQPPRDDSAGACNLPGSPHASKHPSRPDQPLSSTPRRWGMAAGIQGWQHRLGIWGSTSDFTPGKRALLLAGRTAPSSRGPRERRSSRSGWRGSDQSSSPCPPPPHYGRAMLTSLIPDTWWAPSKLNLPLVPCSASC